MTTSNQATHTLHAVLFDLDGVITPTADVHARAWHTVFTEVFSAGEFHNARYEHGDYFSYLDGKPRLEGIATLLAAKNVELAEGSPHDDASVLSVHGIGNRKNEVFLQHIEDGITPYPGSVAFSEYLAQRGVAQAVVSSSKNAPAVLAAAGMEHHFSLIIDGNNAQELGLAGKPAPDTFLYAAQQLGVSPSNAMVIEDATSGVAAAAQGQFSAIVGVDRGASRHALEHHGATHVLTDLAELLHDSSPFSFTPGD